MDRGCTGTVARHTTSNLLFREAARWNKRTSKVDTLLSILGLTEPERVALVGEAGGDESRSTLLFFCSFKTAFCLANEPFALGTTNSNAGGQSSSSIKLRSRLGGSRPPWVSQLTQCRSSFQQHPQIPAERDATGRQQLSPFAVVGRVAVQRLERHCNPSHHSRRNAIGCSLTTLVTGDAFLFLWCEATASW